jgi:hypothetical protein
LSSRLFFLCKVSQDESYKACNVVGHIDGHSEWAFASPAACSTAQHRVTWRAMQLQNDNETLEPTSDVACASSKLVASFKASLKVQAVSNSSPFRPPCKLRSRPVRTS